LRGAASYSGEFLKIRISTIRRRLKIRLILFLILLIFLPDHEEEEDEEDEGADFPAPLGS
jgi:hypothetical protein